MKYICIVLSLFDVVMTQVVGIHHGNEWLVYFTQSMLWLLLTRRRKERGHQHTLYWLNSVRIFRTLPLKGKRAEPLILWTTASWGMLQSPGNRETRAFPNRIPSQYCAENVFLDIRICGFHLDIASQISRFMGPTWGPSGADRTQVGPMLIPWILLSGFIYSAANIISSFHR